jgi:hypothetical protein
MHPTPPHIPRGSKSARPWNEDMVAIASQTYGPKFGSYKQVHQYENELVAKGSLSDKERLSCTSCGKDKKSHDSNTHGEQGMLF